MNRSPAAAPAFELPGQNAPIIIPEDDGGPKDAADEGADLEALSGGSESDSEGSSGSGKGEGDGEGEGGSEEEDGVDEADAGPLLRRFYCPWPADADAQCVAVSYARLLTERNRAPPPPPPPAPSSPSVADPARPADPHASAAASASAPAAGEGGAAGADANNDSDDKEDWGAAHGAVRNRFTGVIARIEKMTTGEDDYRGGYDSEDSFIDDADLVCRPRFSVCPSYD